MSAAAEVALGPGAVVARVRDANGKALPGTLVRLTGPTTRDATTNTAGVAVLVALPAGRYDLSISHAGYATYASSVTIGQAANAPLVFAPQLQVASFANLGNAAGVVAAAADDVATDDPYAAHGFERDASLDVVAGAATPALSVDGTAPYESHVEIDGIPLAGGARSPESVRFRDAPGLDGVQIAAAPFVEGSSPRDAIGGVVNVRTPAVDGPAVAGFDAGYDSSFGSFQHARAVQSYGDLSSAFDAVTGGGEARSQTVKARYAFSSGAAFDVASYGAQAAGTIGTVGVTSNAPAYSAGLRLGVGAGTFDARTYASTLDVTTSLVSPATPAETAHDRGVQLAYDLPLGSDRIRFSFDRRGERTTLGTAPTIDQTFTTFVTRGDFAVARAVRVELADAYGGGTMLRARNDPSVSLAYRPSSAVVVRLAAGSAYATAPDGLLASRTAASPALAPETAFGYRLTGELRPGANDRVWVAAYRERRFETFAPLADAANDGAGAGYAHAPSRGFGAFGSFDVARVERYGAVQSFARVAPAYDAGETGGEPGSKARVAVTYRTAGGCESRAGTTLVGNGNALAQRAVLLGDVSLCVPVFGIVTARLGENNVFGTAVTDPLLAPLFRPREFYLTIGRTR
ncbi:MAG: carboxypeptidase regulatory-like domain-containing protein [Candidatus Eremiobacteraeota bacterium]|nr:carboxypeptidase regulatory-like domain-containing protein [Candidatus Eremiobacteraeota bacterium]